MRLLGACVLSALGAVLTSCAVGPNYRPPALDAPKDFEVEREAGRAPGPAPGDEAALAHWWSQLHDPDLDQLIDQAVHNNLDLLIAINRLQQARTYETVVLGRALPEIDASGAAARGTGSDLARGRAAQNLVSADTSSGLKHINALGGFETAWEVDLFGRLRRDIEASHYDTQAIAAARSGVLSAVMSDVARAYVELRGSQEELAILARATSALEESARIVRIRYERGITNELDVTLATRELATIRAQAAPVQARADAAQYALATLVGRFPEDLDASLRQPKPLPEFPEPMAAGTPVEVLRRRPDVTQAERELAAATARIGVATANLLPRVSLVGSIGAQQQGLGTSPEIGKHLWSFGPGVLWPILDFGALDAQLEIADLNERQSMLRYRRTIIAAVQDVDTAISEFRAAQQSLTALRDGVTAAERAVDLATQRYERGLTEYLGVVDAERQLYDLERQYVAAQVAEGEQFAHVYRSFGGGWQDHQEAPPVRTPLPAIVAAMRSLARPAP